MHPGVRSHQRLPSRYPEAGGGSRTARPPQPRDFMTGTRAFLGMALRHPRHWPALLGLAWSVRLRRWWARPPFLPLPPAEYLEWREATAWHPSDLEGREGAAPEPGAGGPERPDPAGPRPDREALTLDYVRWAAHMRQMIRRRDLPGP
ncbi:MAG: hypothetical protein EA352_05540 [Gemmatimonadales bacterium]|nr:MAG: hypothetical protein EA352_05540 [Gemmatimonadales bacterium]